MVRLSSNSLSARGRPCLLYTSNDPFSENGLTNGKLTLITSGETFVRLTGEEGYSLVLIQTTGDVTDENVQAIQNSVDQTYSFRDKRDERTTGTYMAFVFCVYAFLAIIAPVSYTHLHCTKTIPKPSWETWTVSCSSEAGRLPP